MDEIAFLPLPSGSATCSIHPLSPTTLTDYEHITLSPSPSTHPYQSLAYLERSLCFLIIHEPSGRKMMYDLGVRRDWATAFPQEVAREIKEFYGARVTGDLGELLKEGGVDPGEVDTIFFSHEHWDHTGLITPFPNAALVGGRATFADDLLAQMTAAGREATTVDFEPGQEVGPFEKAVDWVGDGSVWVVHTPGHTEDHISLLVRTTPPTAAEGESWVLLGGDVAHHPCLLCPLASHSHYSLVSSYRNPLLPAESERERAHWDPEIAKQTIKRVKRLERAGNVMVFLAHEFGQWRRWKKADMLLSPEERQERGIMWPAQGGIGGWLKRELKGSREYGLESAEYERVEPHEAFLRGPVADKLLQELGMSKDE